MTLRIRATRDLRRRWQDPPRDWARRHRIHDEHAHESRAKWLASLVEQGYFSERGVLLRDVWDEQNRVWIRASEDKRKARQG